jgi:hypothetical protein
MQIGYRLSAIAKYLSDRSTGIRTLYRVYLLASQGRAELWHRQISSLDPCAGISTELCGSRCLQSK